MLQRGDQKGDRLWDYVGGNLVTRKNPLDEPLDESNYDDRHKDLFNGPIATLKSIGVNTTFVSPIGHYSKKELYEMLPSEVREMVATCSNPWLKDWNECGICKKCESLIKVKEARKDLII